MKTIYASVWKQLPPEQKQLIEDSSKLLEGIYGCRQSFSDYSFLVAPLAKAYEGFLKTFFLKSGYIDEHEFYGDHFRVGKVLNPSLKKQRFSVYKKLSKEKGERTADFAWKTWKEGRNLVFHYFPHNLKRLSLEEAKERIDQIIEAINLLSGP